MNWGAALGVARQEAGLSRDPSMKVGAVLAGLDGMPIVATAAHNRLPLGIADLPERWERPAKYRWLEHAERGTIYRAARRGIPTKGLTLVSTWTTCTDCARAVICAGLKRVVFLPVAATPHWADDFALAVSMLEEAGLQIIHINERGEPHVP